MAAQLERCHPETLAGQIVQHGYVVVPNYLPSSDIAGLREECQRLDDAGCFRPAGIGTGGDLRVRDDVRGDRICWIDPATSAPVVTQVLAKLDALRVAVNREMYLGLLDFEGHFARYSPGAGYRRHYDQLRGSNKRQLTITLYLNDDWHDEEGGQLRVYLDNTRSERVLEITPHGGTLVVFLSERFAHEVLPSARTRLSLTGWFLRRS